MNNQMPVNNEYEPAAKCGTTVLCFAAIIIGQGWLLRDRLMGAAGGWSIIMIVELLFCIAMAAAIVWCWTHPKGWTDNKGCIAVFVIYGVYVVYNILAYNTLAEYYLAGIETQYNSWGKALVAFKLVLGIMGVVAGVPSAVEISDREYADKLRQAVYKQDAEWAKSSARGAQKDLSATIEKLKSTLSQEEYEELVRQLQEDAAQNKKSAETGLDADHDGQIKADDNAAAAAETDEQEGESAAERMRGWGGGM